MMHLQPISIPGSTPDYHAALPTPSLEVCGTQGVYVRVGNIVYRGTFDPQRGSGSWAFSYIIC